MSHSSSLSLTAGDRCLVGTKRGVVRFVGSTSFAAGSWLGVELDDAEGKNDGSVQGVRYFTCAPLHGLFVKQGMAKRDTESAGANEPTASASAAVSARRDELQKLRESKQQIQQSEEGAKVTQAHAPAKSAAQPPTATSGREREETKTAKADSSEATLLRAELVTCRTELESLRSQVSTLTGARVSLVSAHESEVQSLRSLLESLEVDKQLNEEQIDALEAELSEATDKLAAAESECATLREQVSQSKEGWLQSLQSVTSGDLDMIKLQDSNAQLSSALRALRDLTVSEKSKHAEQLATLQAENSELHHFRAQYESASKKLDKLSKELDDYRAQLDLLSESEQMMDALSEKVLKLSDECQQHRATIEYLTTLCDASEEVEAGHLQLESELSHELESKEAVIGDFTARLTLAQTKISELNDTVRKFRELVHGMEIDAQLMREKQIHQSASANAHSHPPASVDHRTIKLTQIKRELQARHIETARASIEATQARVRSDFLAQYMPDEVSIDEQSLSLLLALHRLQHKCSALIDALQRHYASADTFDEELRALAATLSILAAECLRLVMHISGALAKLSEDQFARACDGAVELDAAADAIDEFLAAIEHDTLNENLPLAPILNTHNTLQQFGLERAGMRQPFVDTLVTGTEEASASQNAPALPFSVTFAHLARKFAPGRAEFASLDASLAALSAAIEARTIVAPAESPLTAVLDARSLCFQSALLSIAVSQCGDAVHSIESARREADIREQAEKGHETSSATAAAKRGESVSAVSLASAVAEDGADGPGFTASAASKAFAELEDIFSTVPAIAAGVQQHAATLELATHRKSAEVHSQSAQHEIARLFHLCHLRSQRCQAELAALSSALRAIATDERLQSVRLADRAAESELVRDAETAIRQPLSGPNGIHLRHELDQFKAAMLELTRQINRAERDAATRADGTSAATATATTVPPAYRHAATVRAQLGSAAASRIAAQELTAKLSEKQRELLGLRSQHQEQAAKIAMLTTKLQRLAERAEGEGERQQELETLRAEHQITASKLSAALEESDKLSRENKVLRKQAIKLKHAQSKKEGEAKNTDALAASALDSPLLTEAVAVLRKQLSQSRSERAKHALQCQLPPLPLIQQAQPAEDAQSLEKIVSLRSNLATIHTQLVDFRVNARVLPLPVDGALQSSATALLARVARFGQLSSEAKQLAAALDQFTGMRRVATFRATRLDCAVPSAAMASL